MKFSSALSVLTRLVGLLALLLTVYAVYALAAELAHGRNVSTLFTIRRFAPRVDNMFLSIMSLFVAFRAKSRTGIYMVALFLAVYAINNTWFVLTDRGQLLKVIYDNITSCLTGILLVLSMQFFPSRITVAEVNSSIRNKPFNRYLRWMLKPMNLWIYFAIVIMIVTTGCYLVTGISLEWVFELLICTCVIGYLWINYKRSGLNGRNSVLWLFWGVFTYMLTLSLYELLLVFNHAQAVHIESIFVITLNIVISTTFFMSIFFASTFDTGFIISRTIVNGLLFLVVILLYDTVEHYIVHAVNEHLAIDSALISSFLSSILILLISPLHHRLNKFLGRKLKHKQMHE